VQDASGWRRGPRAGRWAARCNHLSEQSIGK
jgi:hypothetical protein